jgi:hypothetical protein
MNPLTFFGYKIKLPDDTTYHKFYKELYGINSIIEPPFNIMSILTYFDDRIQWRDSTDYEPFVHLVIGFKPPNDINELVELSKQLAEYIVDNPLLEGLEIEKKTQFFSGINWEVDDSAYDESDSDTSSDDSDEDDEEEEDITSSEEGESIDIDEIEGEVEELDEVDLEALGIQEYKN